MKNWDYRMSAEDFAGTESYNEESIDDFLLKKFRSYYIDAKKYGARHLSVSNALEDVIVGYLRCNMDSNGSMYMEFRKELAKFIGRHEIVSALDWDGWAAAELRKYVC